MTTLLDALRTCTVDTYAPFTLDGHVTTAKAVANYDGDTVDLVLAYNDTPMRVKARMYGYDAPELRPRRSLDGREAVMRAADAAKSRLWELLTGERGVEPHACHDHLLTASCGAFDKYGRVLVTLFPLDAPGGTHTFAHSINQRMIDDGHGVPYYGGKRG